MYYQGSLVFVPDGSDLVTADSWVVSYWLYEVILVPVSDCRSFLATDIEVTFADVCVGLVTRSLYALEARGFGELDISVPVEE